MSVLDLYEEFRVTFPDITVKADSIHIKQWGDIDPDFAYSWFESLANAINGEMRKSVNVQKYSVVFEFFRKKYLFEGGDVKNCIDVSFIENLFWQVNPESSKSYWEALPEVLKGLYIGFHSRVPA
jgi:hypothetical protein